MATTLEKPEPRVAADPRATSRCSARRATRTCRWPRFTRRPSSATRASLPPKDRSSCAPARTPAARPRTSTSSTSPTSHDEVWWGGFNQPISEERYDALKAQFMDHMNKREVFVQEGFVGADPRYRRALRAYTETAWASIFCGQPLHPPRGRRSGRLQAELHDHRCAPFRADPAARRHAQRDGHPGPPCQAGDPDRRHAVRRRDQEGRVRDHELPPAGRGRAADALVGQRRQRTATWRSSSACRAPARRPFQRDPERILIGDDEHGWSDDGVFNFEGGCYAKTIRLSHIYEPDIYSTTQRFGTILENVDIDPDTRELNLDSDKLHGEHARRLPAATSSATAPTSGMAGHPSTIIFLTADAFGVLPPISRLTRDQAMYHFISGYTAKLAGTEVGVKEPSATFSTCFGAPFMPRHPSVYAEMLGERMDRYDVPVWLVNTGWTGGPYGAGGERMNIAQTRQMVRAALNGRLDDVPDEDATRSSASRYPTTCPDVPTEVLWPRDTWADKDAYDRQAQQAGGNVRRELPPVRGRRGRSRSATPARSPADRPDLTANCNRGALAEAGSGRRGRRCQRGRMTPQSASCTPRTIPASGSFSRGIARLDIQRQLTDRREGTFEGFIDRADGENIWWFDDTDGDEFGRWMVDAVQRRRTPTRRRRAGSVLQHRPGARPIAGRGRWLDGRTAVSIHVVRAGRLRAPKIYAQRAGDVAGRHVGRRGLLCFHHSEHGDTRHPALRVVDMDGATVGELWDGPGLGLESSGFSRVPGDERVLVTARARRSQAPADLVAALRGDARHPARPAGRGRRRVVSRRHAPCWSSTSTPAAQRCTATTSKGSAWSRSADPAGRHRRGRRPARRGRLVPVERLGDVTARCARLAAASS